MPETLYVVLDANILFSATYQLNHPFLQFWKTPDVVSMTSGYAVKEVQRNCKNAEHLSRLEHLLKKTTIVSDVQGEVVPSHVKLPPKDRPILASALHAGAHYLITGDMEHFGALMDRLTETSHGNITVLRPSVFLAMLAKRT
jgi:predicted nucleic acid-binding protein